MPFHTSRMSWALIFACLSMFVLGISDNIRGPLYPELLSAFSLKNSIGSFSFAVASFAALCGNASAAYILRWVRIDKLLAWAVGLMMVGVLLMGAAPFFGWFLLGSFLFGFGMGATGVAQNLLIAENVMPPLQTKALSVLHGLYGLSSLLAPYLASRAPKAFAQSEITSGLGWQSAFFVCGAIALVVLGLILMVRPTGEFVHHDTQSDAFKQPRSYKTMLWFAGFFATYVASEILVSSRLALYMRSYFGLSLEQSSNYVTYFFVCLLAGRLLFAVKTFRFDLRHQLNGSLLLSIFFLILGLWLNPWFLVLTGLSMAPFYPLAIVYIADRAGVQKRRFITFAMGIQSVCVILMHLGVGYLTDLLGLSFAFSLGIVLLIIALLCLNFHPKVSS